MASSSRSHARHIVLTGIPGVGKSTLICKACEVLKEKGCSVQGFYTEEIRANGKRTGFDVVTLNDGTRSPLARVKSDGMPANRSEPRVGQYAVQLQSFESLALPAIKINPERPKAIIVIDEIGKMELFSSRFVSSVRKVMASDSTLLCTIPVPKGRPIALVEEIRNTSNAKVYTITHENRNSILDDIVTSVLEAQQNG